MKFDPRSWIALVFATACGTATVASNFPEDASVPSFEDASLSSDPASAIADAAADSRLTDAFADAADPNEEFIEGTFDGVTYRLKPSVTDVIQASPADSFFRVSVGGTSSAGISLTFYPSIGTTTCFNFRGSLGLVDSKLFHYEAPSGYSTCAIAISKYGAVGEPIDGTFAGTLFRPVDGGSLAIQGTGSFHLMRRPDDASRLPIDAGDLNSDPSFWTPTNPGTSVGVGGSVLALAYLASKNRYLGSTVDGNIVYLDLPISEPIPSWKKASVVVGGGFRPSLACSTDTCVAASFGTSAFGRTNDGLTWTVGAFPGIPGQTTKVAAVVHMGTQFIAFFTNADLDAGTERYGATSPDGLTWTAFTYSPNECGQMQNLTWTGTVLLSVGYTDGATKVWKSCMSTDGLVWSNARDFQGTLNANGSHVVAVTNSQPAISDDNGTSWSSVALPTGVSHGRWTDTEYLFLGVAVQRGVWFTSPDGISVTAHTQYFWYGGNGPLETRGPAIVTPDSFHIK